MAFSNYLQHFGVNGTVMDQSNQSFDPSADLSSSTNRSGFQNIQNKVSPFDQPFIRALLFAVYSTVFILIFFGNLAVVLVTTLHWRMRKTATFCLFHLAIANLCVGIFCVYQNLSLYLIESWIFGDLMCKMYFFIMSLSYTASILILVVIAIERYVVIMHPFKGRQLVTIGKLQIAIFVVWILSGAISFHRFYSVSTFENSLPGGKKEIICSPSMLLHNHKAVDLANFLLLFLLPLFVISVLYTRVCLHLKRQSQRFHSVYVAASSISSESPTKRETLKRLLTSPTALEMRTEMENDVELIGLKTVLQRKNIGEGSNNNNSSPRFLRFRRGQTLNQILQPNATHKGVIRMLLVVVITFALCNFPFHLRKMYQNYFARRYLSDFPLFDLVTPATFLTMYANCAISPFIYAFMNKRFRACLIELLSSGCRRIKRRH